jgi:hypothetical protein
MPFIGVGLALFLFELQLLKHQVTRQILKLQVWWNVILRFDIYIN